MQTGVLEIFTKIEENHTFVLEKLFRGSIINYRTMFLEEGAKCWLRCGRNCVVSALPATTVNEHVPKHLILKKKYIKFKNQTIV